MLALPLTAMFPLKAFVCLAVVAGVAAARISRANHPHQAFGPANYVTAVRALLVAVVAGLIGEPPAQSLATVAVAASIAATALDGLDGWLARRSRMASAFGARFDMEVDALLIMALSALAWTYGKAGAWVLLSGLLRYGFVAAGWIWEWMERPLEPSRRRQTVCVIQIVSLIVVVSPIVPPPASTLIAASALAALTWSFFVDTRWLYGAKQVA